MKKLHPLLSVLFLISLGFGQKLYEVIETYENGNIKSITYHKKIRNSIVKVKLEHYWENGRKSGEITLKDGKLELMTEWYENGQKLGEFHYKDGKRNGLSTNWYESGNIVVQSTFNNDELDGLITQWYENGQKKFERNFKDGKSDGLSTFWYENGQKKKEGTFKDGKEISSKEWNEDGSVKE